MTAVATNSRIDSLATPVHRLSEQSEEHPILNIGSLPRKRVSAAGGKQMSPLRKRVQGLGVGQAVLVAAGVVSSSDKAYQRGSSICRSANRAMRGCKFRLHYGTDSNLYIKRTA